MVLELSQRKVNELAGAAPDRAAWSQGLPEVYDHLIMALQYMAKYGVRSPAESDERAASLRAEKMMRLGLTVSQVVHGYGAICQAITEAAQEQSIAISTSEFNVLNRVLDIAIGEAVTAYEGLHNGIVRKEESQRLGTLAHELRNALTSVTLAHVLIRDGTVAARGETNNVLENGLHRMRDIIDRSLEEVRLQSGLKPEIHRLRLLDVVEEVRVLATSGSRDREVKFLVQVAPTIMVDADPHHIVSALSNLVQNAMKCTKPGTTVRLSAQDSGAQVKIEVEDECGGLPPGQVEALFKPFTQAGPDRSGVGLGLTISRRATEINGGSLSAQDFPGKGCIFTITLPSTAGKPEPAVSEMAASR
jgi:signal transduction histidine kinase